MSKRHPWRHAFGPRPAWLRRLRAKYDAPMHARRRAHRAVLRFMLAALVAIAVLVALTA